MTSPGLAPLYRILYTEPMDKIASISHVRAHLPEIISGFKKNRRSRVIITRNGSAAAVLLSPEELETLEILADRELMLSLLKAEDDIRAGRIVKHEDVFR